MRVIVETAKGDYYEFMNPKDVQFDRYKTIRLGKDDETGKFHLIEVDESEENE